MAELKIVTVVGARPQFVKAAVVSRALQAAAVEEAIVHTGQHFDANMSEIFFGELQVPEPACNLGIGGGSHGQNTGRMLESIERVLEGESPDMVLVYGDTDSTLAGALAAVKLHIPVAHVEAGLRSFNRRMPEEINRVLTDHAASLLFAPTEVAVDNLLHEGVDQSMIHNVGDVMYDASLFYGALAEKRSSILERLALGTGGYVLATVHRAENVDDEARLSAILRGLGEIDTTVVMPLHPRTRARIEEFHLQLSHNIRMIDPVGYLDMVMLEKHAVLIATDSGGVQKEAFFHGVPCVTLREETEWVELVNSGWNRLAVPGDSEGVRLAVMSAIGTSGQPVRPYGDGEAGERIVEILKHV